MRIAIIGATGNVGTAVLRELAQHAQVTSLLGVARREPATDAEPYRDAEWATVDIQFPEAIDELTEIFEGVDAVIHLAWLLQPNDNRDLLRRVNVEGTRHVLQAAGRAGVQQITVASSVGAYAPVEGNDYHSEDWPTYGIPTSHYSVDKAAQEEVCDAFEAQYPEVSLARLRPGLIFQRVAGAQVQRYFAGSWAPLQILNFIRPPILPLPSGVRAQAVHTEDIAQAFAQAVLHSARGAFNVCADDVLNAGAIADVVTRAESGRRSLSLPVTPLRTVVKAGHRIGLIPADEGWLDMGSQAPLMDNSRAKEELHWQPRWTAKEALTELVEGLAGGEGADSVPLRPRPSRRRR